MPIRTNDNMINAIHKLTIGLFLMVCSTFVLAADVLLMVDGVRGQGTLQQRGDECLIITPRHVVEEAISDVVATFPDRREVVATILESYAEDVSLLRLASQPADGCAKRAFDEERLSSLLNAATEGVLKRRDESGSASLLQVDIVGYDEHRLIRVEPRSPSKSIKQGYSGSVLYIDSQAVGMLINNENETGLVLRAEMLNATIDPFFHAATGNRAILMQLDDASEFLLTDFHGLARERQVTVVEDTNDKTLSLFVETDMREINTDTDKIVEFETRLIVQDALDRTIADQTIVATGNSFVSLESAQKNAQAQLAERIRQSGLLDDLP